MSDLGQVIIFDRKLTKKWKREKKLTLSPLTKAL